MWEAREKTWLENLRHEMEGVVKRARADRRYLPRDFSRLCLGGWRTREAFTRLVAATRPKTPGFRPSDQALGLAQGLRQDGFTAPLPLITPAQAAEIRTYFEAQTYVDPYRDHLGRFRYPECPSPESNQGYYDERTIVEAPYLLELVNHPLVLETAEVILGCKPSLDNLACFWYFTGREREKGFQRFHRDYDTPRFFKLFLYLTDTDERSGAHVFVRGSQRSNRLNVLRYIGDDEVEAAYGRDQVRVIGGPAGTCFLADVYGVHKGGLPLDRPRLAFFAQYNLWNSPFAPPAPFRRRERHFDRYINRAYLHD